METDGMKGLFLTKIKGWNIVRFMHPTLCIFLSKRRFDLTDWASGVHCKKPIQAWRLPMIYFQTRHALWETGQTPPFWTRPPLRENTRRQTPICMISTLLYTWKRHWWVYFTFQIVPTSMSKSKSALCRSFKTVIYNGRLYCSGRTSVGLSIDKGLTQDCTWQPINRSRRSMEEREGSRATKLKRLETDDDEKVLYYM